MSVVDRVGGSAAVWRHAQPRRLRRSALVRGPRGGMVGGWGSETPYKAAATHLTDSLTCSYLHSLKPVLCWNILFSALHLAFLHFYHSERNRLETWVSRNIVVNKQWMKCSKCLLARTTSYCLLDSFTTCKLNIIESLWKSPISQFYQFNV